MNRYTVNVCINLRDQIKCLTSIELMRISQFKIKMILKIHVQHSILYILCLFAPLQLVNNNNVQKR